MFKLLLLFFFLTLTMSGESIYFKEEKFLLAVNASFSKKGKIDFLENSIKIAYPQDKSYLTYTESTLIIEKEGEKQEIDLSKRVSIKIFFELFRAIYFENETYLNSFFKVTTFDGITTLDPLPIISSYIHEVRYKKSKEKRLKFLEIEFSSGDRRYIEEID